MVTQEEVKGLVGHAFEKYDLLDLFPEIGEFYLGFRVLHAQLRKGDRLEIRVETRHDPEDSKWWRMPALTAYLVPEVGKEKRVLEFGTWEGSRTEESLLYDD